MFGFARFFFLLCLVASIARAQSGVPVERLSRLGKGVNLSHWLWLTGPRQGPARLEFITDADLRSIRAAGLTHVRLPFEPGEVWDHERHEIKAGGLAELRTAVDRCLKADLSVIVDAHPNESPWVTHADHFDEFVRFWAALAPRLSDEDPDRVFLELLNEPHDSAGQWPTAQARLVAAVRAAAPRHTILATGEEWSNIPGLIPLKPLADPDIVYTFHFYEPHTFTHQGATWGWPPWEHIRGLPYPSTPDLVSPIAAGIEDKQARDAVLGYGRERWDAERIRAEIAKASAWAASNHVPVYCGEFGAYASFTPRDARLAWLHDTSSALGESKIGWCMWDYAGGFALFQGNPGGRAPDRDVALTLGLAPP
jgi:aryl-phospho-beta-D-glucosidase BglC (GH1 family)